MQGGRLHSWIRQSHLGGRSILALGLLALAFASLPGRLRPPWSTLSSAARRGRLVLPATTAPRALHRRCRVWRCMPVPGGGLRAALPWRPALSAEACVGLDLAVALSTLPWLFGSHVLARSCSAWEGSRDCEWCLPNRRPAVQMRARVSAGGHKGSQNCAGFRPCTPSAAMPRGLC